MVKCVFHWILRTGGPLETKIQSRMLLLLLLKTSPGPTLAPYKSMSTVARSVVRSNEIKVARIESRITSHQKIAVFSRVSTPKSWTQAKRLVNQTFFSGFVTRTAFFIGILTLTFVFLNIIFFLALWNLFLMLFFHSLEYLGSHQKKLFKVKHPQFILLVDLLSKWLWLDWCRS